MICPFPFSSESPTSQGHRGGRRTVINGEITVPVFFPMCFLTNSWPQDFWRILSPSVIRSGVPERWNPPSRTPGQKGKRWDLQPILCDSKGFAPAKRCQFCFPLSCTRSFKEIVSVGGSISQITLHWRVGQNLIPWHLEASAAAKFLVSAEY